MSTFIVFDIDVHDTAGYEEYRRLGSKALADYGSRFLVRGGPAETLEGDWNPRRIVVLEFDSDEQARGWYHSTDYQAAKHIRDQTARSIGIIVQGA